MPSPRTSSLNLLSMVKGGSPITRQLAHATDLNVVMEISRLLHEPSVPQPHANAYSSTSTSQNSSDIFSTDYGSSSPFRDFAFASQLSSRTPTPDAGPHLGDFENVDFSHFDSDDMFGNSNQEEDLNEGHNFDFGRDQLPYDNQTDRADAAAAIHDTRPADHRRENLRITPFQHTRFAPPIDLTASSPASAAGQEPTRKRRRLEDSPVQPSSRRRAPPWNLESNARPYSAVSPQARRHRTSQRAQTPVPEISLVDEDDSYAATLSKQRFEQIASQNTPSTTLPSAQNNGIGVLDKGPLRHRTKLNTLTCTVCLDSVTDLTATPCGHAFCRPCLMSWIGTKDAHIGRRPTCPACRAPLSMKAKNPTVTLEIMKRDRGHVMVSPKVVQDG